MPYDDESMHDAPSGDAAALWATQFGRLAAVHQQFVEAQADAHGQFLALRSRIHRDALVVAAHAGAIEILHDVEPEAPRLFLFDEDGAPPTFADAPLARTSAIAPSKPLAVEEPAPTNGHRPARANADASDPAARALRDADSRDVAVLPDLDGNGVAEAGVLLIRNSDGHIVVQRRNAAGTQAPVDYWFSP